MFRNRVAIAGIAMTGLLAGGCAVRDRLFNDREELVATRTPCADQTVSVYFDHGHAGLSQPAQELIGRTAESLRACAIDRVRVIGLADASGGASRNLNLSERRALAVTEALAAHGLPAPAFEMIAAGEDGARREDGAAEPVRRRVEIIVEASPPGA